MILQVNLGFHAVYPTAHYEFIQYVRYLRILELILKYIKITCVKIQICFFNHFLEIF